MKGNVIVGQSGGPTAAINASLAGVYCQAKECGAKKIYGMCNGIQGLLEEKFIDLSDYVKNDLDVELLKRTPAAFLGSCRYKLPKIAGNEDTYDRIFEILRKLNIEVFIYTGGNDSMDTIKQLSDYAAIIGEKEMKFVGCPKTIDNDLALTDHTPGYGSAAKYIGTSVKEIAQDAGCFEYKNGFVTVIEIMGRNAGWLTAAAALAKDEDCTGADLIYLPEIPFDMDKFREKLEELLAEKSTVIVAVSEGIKLADGRYVCELGANSDAVDAFGHKQLTGTANYLASWIAGEFGCKARAVEFSTLQRCASHCASLIDITEGFEAGRAAVKAGDDGETGVMIVFLRISENPYASRTEVKDISQIANEERTVPRAWVNEDGTYVTDKYLQYVRPLIQGELSPVMVNGMPRHLHRKK